MKENKLIKFLIPVVAVVIIFESIVLVPYLSKGSNQVNEDSNSEELSKELKESEEPVVDFVFESDSQEMKVGKSYKVILNLVGRKDLQLDGVEAYVKYDPSLLTVTRVTSGKDLSQYSTKSKINDKTGVASTIFLVPKEKKCEFVKDEVNEIMSFVVTPKTEGSTDLSLVTGAVSDEAVTLVVESGSSKALNFSESKLVINTTK